MLYSQATSLATGRTTSIASPSAAVRSWFFHTLVQGAGTGRRTYCCLMPGRLLVGDTTPTDQVVMVKTIISGILPVPSPHRPRARAHAQPSSGGRRRVGGAAQAAHGRPPVVGRWWTPIGSRRHALTVDVDLTERACRPLIRLSTHQTTAARGTCQRAASFDLFVQSCLGVNPVPTPGHPRRARCRRAQRRVGAPDDHRPSRPMNADHVKAAHRRLGSSTRKQHAVAAVLFFFWPLVRVVYLNGEGPRSIGSEPVIVPTMSGRRRRLQRGRRAAQRTLQRPAPGRPYQCALHVRDGRGAEPPAF
ncbi:hypothetical protein EVAR_57915_1 [Eumeta japonica]|uniref:Uncharacterized protein n=1 Tax=Eumeta variegata TaxID=151549 RepID=A0A4C1ZQB7_EUMVA|nr:hypothetical protein EVAR_57915_1 [Eumeta japonica]